MEFSANKKLVKLFMDQAWNHGRFNLLEGLVQKDFIYTNNFSEQAMTYVGFCHYVGVIRSAIPDLLVVIDEIIEENNRLVTRSTFNGTATKTLFGVPPNGKIIALESYSFWQIEHQKIKNLNTIADLADLRPHLQFGDVDKAQLAAHGLGLHKV